MRDKLLALDLAPEIADGILSHYETHKRTLKIHDKPKGMMELEKNLDEVLWYSKGLQKCLKNLSRAEKQLLNIYCYPKIFDIVSGLIRLNISCDDLKKRKVKISRKRDPFLINLTIDLWNLLEDQDISVTIYKNSILCKILNILFAEAPRKRRAAETEAPEDLFAFNLVRQAATRRINKHI